MGRDWLKSDKVIFLEKNNLNMNTLKLKEYQEQLLQEKKSITESLDYKELSGRGNCLNQDPN
jgi:hypothetical protein